MRIHIQPRSPLLWELSDNDVPGLGMRNRRSSRLSPDVSTENLKGTLERSRKRQKTAPEGAAIVRLNSCLSLHSPDVARETQLRPKKEEGCKPRP